MSLLLLMNKSIRTFSFNQMVFLPIAGILSLLVNYVSININMGGLKMEGLTINMIKAFFKGFFAVWPLFVFLFIVALIKLIFLWNEKKRLARSGVNEIDQMNGKTFEKYLEVLFKKLGYQVERTRYVGDYGADLVVRKNGIKTIIQAKRYKKNVGIKAVQEAVAAKGYYKCDESMVVTNSFYSKQAIELAKANHVKLWNRNDLVNALLSVKGEKEQVSTTVINPATEISAVTDETPQKEEVFENTCVICGAVVSEKVRKYCLDNAERFGSKIYCFQHQKGVKR